MSYSSLVSVGLETEIQTEPLAAPKTLASFRLLNDIARTSYGPTARLKAIQNAESNVITLTSSSSVLFHRISPSNPFIRLIFGCVKNHLITHNDCGLLIVLIITSLVLKSLDLNLSKILIVDLNDYFAQICLTYLNSDECLCKDDVKLETAYLLTVVETIISSKPACVLSKNERKHLSLLLLKAFLNIIPNTGVGKMGKIEINTQEGLSVIHSNVINGLLIPCQSLSENICNKLSKKKLKVILFATSLSGEAEFSVNRLEVDKEVFVWKEILDHLKNLCDKIIGKKIDIVACQKVIHPVLRCKLEKADILVVDRLGSELTQAFQDLISQWRNYGMMWMVKMPQING